MADICILQVCSHYDWFLSGKVTVTAVCGHLSSLYLNALLLTSSTCTDAPWQGYHSRDHYFLLSVPSFV